MANEKRVIDAETVRHKINALASSVVHRGNAEMFTGKDTCNPHEYTRGYERGILDAQKIVCGEETVDAVEVVLCKKCKFYELQYYACGPGMGCTNSKAIWTTTQPDDFCSYGERKDGE